MKLRMFAGLFTLLLVVVLIIGGITTAFFTGKESPPSAAAFLMGTVDIDITAKAVAPAEFRWEINPGEDCREFTWIIRNIGSKRLFLRAWLDETLRHPGETAWVAQQNPGETTFPGASNWATYVTYPVGEKSAAHAITYPLFAGQYHPAGTIRVWHNTKNIFVEYKGAGWAISGAHLAVADDLGLIPRAPGGPMPGRFPFQAEFDELKETYTFTIPMRGTYEEGALVGRDYEWHTESTLYIAAHADMVGMDLVSAGGAVSWNQRADCPYQWTEHDGYWYYCLHPVMPGEEISLCLTGCPQQAGVYNVKLYAEAVQGHPDAVRERWGDDLPCLQP